MSFPNHFKTQQQTRHPGFEYEMQPHPIFDDESILPKGNLLQGQVALITGGDSGIGRAVAVAYAKQGANIAIVYYNVFLLKEILRLKLLPMMWFKK